MLEVVEPYLPILIIVVILFVITVLLSIADKLLVSYGDCRIKVKKEDEEKEFVVPGGATLLSALIDNGMQIPASCGGRGTCGYCKVNVKCGGGELLPTEEIFVSKEEEQAGAQVGGLDVHGDPEGGWRAPHPETRHCPRAEGCAAAGRCCITKASIPRR